MKLTPLKEVILYAGAIDFPKLLLLSGMGPRNHLQEMGVDVLVESPAVGTRQHNDGYCHLVGPRLLDVFQQQQVTPSQWSKWAVQGVHIWGTPGMSQNESPRYDFSVYVEYIDDALHLAGDIEPLNLAEGKDDLAKFIEAAWAVYNFWHSPVMENLTGFGAQSEQPPEDVFLGGNETLEIWIRKNCHGDAGHPQGGNVMGRVARGHTH
eukprot:g70254.t1